MEKGTDLCTLVILDSTRCLIAQRLDEDATLTIVALVSEDPANWSEALSVWPRYRTPVVCESPSGLPLEEVSRQEAMEILANSDSWIVIDFESKRISNGGCFEPIGREASFSMEVDDDGSEEFPLFINLPPWWELHEEVSLVAVTEPRKLPIGKPVVDRDVLYGDAFLMDVAIRALEVVGGEDWNPTDNEQRDFDALTVRLHRDWLMSPRDDLGGRKPRELLHGAIHWIDSVTQSQEQRYVDGDTLIAVPCDWQEFPRAPMGSQEMCMYYDYCREAIRLAWSWCSANDAHIATQVRQRVLCEMVESLKQSMGEWMASPFEDGPTPAFIIQCDRARVPIGDGVQIEGIEGVSSEVHNLDCNCPICAMMADGVFGTSFSRIDGHHLELDGEFAFSMTESFEDWESENQEYEEFSEGFEPVATRAVAIHTDDSLGSAWMGSGSGKPIPGDRRGLLKMAFMVAEIVKVLDTHWNRSDQIHSLNAAFSEYRNAQVGDNKKARKKLKRVLESLAKRNPELVSKSADLQSYIDEFARSLVID